MAPTNYERGVATERRMTAELREQGFQVIRASSSKGPYDLVAVRADKVVLVSCKRSTTWQGAARAYKKERANLEALDFPKSPKVERWLAVWADKVGTPHDPQKGGLWFCQEIIPPVTKEAA